MTLTTKIVRQYQCCGQVMPVPVVIKKLSCWRRPVPLYPPPCLPPYPQPPYPQPYLQPYLQPYPQPYSQPYPLNAVQQVYPQQLHYQQQQHYPQQQQQQQQQYAITAPSEPAATQEFQTQSISLPQNDSDSNYHRPPDYPIVEYSSEIIMPTGNIVIQTTDTVPDGYLLCNGTDVSREIEATLFSVIGTFYGEGDGSTTFCLPDLEDEERPTHHYMIKR